MIVYTLKWNIHPEKIEAYNEWTVGAIQRTLSVGDVAEFRGYRPAIGNSQVVVTYEFSNMAAWTSWNDHDSVREVLTELHDMVEDISIELWEPTSSCFKPSMVTCACV